MGYRILRLGTPESDPSSMLNDALEKHPNVDEVVVTGTTNWKMKDELDDFDFWIGGGAVGRAPGEKDYDPENQVSNFMRILGEKGKRKWVIWDQRAMWDLWEYGLDNCLVYFKKAWREKKYPPKVHLLTWPVIDMYLKVPTDIYDKSKKGRDIDIGYYFGSLTSGRLSGTRKTIMKCIEAFNWEYTCVEFFYTLGGAYHPYDFYNFEPLIDGRFNWWLLYMHLLRRTKIIFTSTGFPGFFGGDRRSAEAISSGGLVFADEPVVQMPHPFEHGKHLFFFDSKSPDEINKALEMAKSFISESRSNERKKIAQAGLEHALMYHRSQNYVDYMMEIIKKERKKLHGN